MNYARKEFCSEWNADISLQLHLQLQLLPVEPRKRHADGSCGQPFNPHEKLYRKFKKEAISELGLAPVYAAKCACAGSRAASSRARASGRRWSAVTADVVRDCVV